MSHTDLDAIRKAHKKLCQYNGKGCAREDTCKLSMQAAKGCAWYAYFHYLTKEMKL